jgi:hypothetical protein
MKLKKLQYAALVRREETLLVWHDDLQQILPHSMRLEEKLLSLVWGSTVSPFKNPFDTPTPSSANSSFYNLFPGASTSVEKHATTTVTSEKDGVVIGYTEDEMAVDEPESLDRPSSFVSAVFVGLAVCLLIVLLFGFATANLLVEFMYDGQAMRLILLVTLPLLGLVGLFL